MTNYADNIPLYARIAGVVRQRIETGELAIGAMLPTLEAFMAEFGASRVTVRLAMDMLGEEQLIARRRGFGTVVTARPKNHRDVVLPDSWDKLMARLTDVKRRVLAIEEEATPSADELNLNDDEKLPERTRFVRMLALHTHAGEAYCYVDAWINARTYNASSRALKSKPALIVLVEKHNDRVANVTQTMTLGLADIEVAKALDIGMGSPIALVRRTVFDAKGERVYASRVHFPASVVRTESVLYAK
jgi:GntR family transcriptional regulator